MLRDAQGLDVTTDSTKTITAIDQFVDQALSYGKQAESVILEGIVADPTCAIAHTYAAAYYLSQESTAGWHQAIPHLREAKRYQAWATEREQLWIKAITAWAKQDIDQAIAYHQAIADRFPRDLVSIQQAQYHYFYRGDKESLLEIAKAVLPANSENHYLYGMIAFGLEQCHCLQEAESIGRQAIEIDRHDPWAHHAVAHVMETQGRVDEGISWMETFADSWENCNSMLYTHNWWHVALYYLEKHDQQKVLSLYDAKVWGRARQTSSKDQVGAISLLLRLELRGIEVGEKRWQDLGLHLFPRIYEHALPFQDLHYIYALERARYSEWVQNMLLSMETHALQVKSQQQKPWTNIAIPAAKGMVAHARGDWQRTIAFLKPILPKLQTIGGSHAQRDLFEQVYLNALLHAGQQQEASYLLEKRRSSRPRATSIHPRLVSIHANQNLIIKAS
jgi:tetratricopeptide (TPR) repeat protein